MVNNSRHFQVKAICFETMEQAISFLRPHLKSGDMVLLSPACASLDQFASFEKRGEEFTRSSKISLKIRVVMEFINKIKQNYEQWARVTPQGLLYDRALFWLVVLLLIGLVAVTSASMPYSARVFNDTFYFAKRDAVYVLLSLATCYLTLKFLLLNGKSGTQKFSC